MPLATLFGGCITLAKEVLQESHSSERGKKVSAGVEKLTEHSMFIFVKRPHGQTRVPSS